MTRSQIRSGKAWPLAVLLLALGACTSPGAQRIVGPDGSLMSHVHCGSDQGACFRIAGELCPSGYDMKPVLSGSDGNFLVRCRAAATMIAGTGTPVASPGLAAPAPGASTVSSTRSAERWPPASEPWPAAYPWPPPETSAAAQQPGGTAATPRAPTAEVDLGY